MALGDLVQMLEGLPGSMGDVPYSTESAELPWLACGQTGWNPATNSCNPLTPVKSGTDWTPYVLGGATLLAVWALFFRESRGLRGTDRPRNEHAQSFMTFQAQSMTFPPYEGVHRTGTRSEWAPLPPARRNYSPMRRTQLGGPLLDKAVNLFGKPLGDAEKKRINKMLQKPTMASWKSARSIVINETRPRTLWQAVVALEPVYSDPEQMPDALTVARAIRQCAGGKSVLSGTDSA